MSDKIGIYLIEKHLVDLHDYQGKFNLVVTLKGPANDLDKEHLCTALLEKYVRDWGFHIRDLKVITRCFYQPFFKQMVTRTFIYEKIFPPRYDKKGTLFNQKYTDKVRRQVEILRAKAEGHMKCELFLG